MGVIRDSFDGFGGAREPIPGWLFLMIVAGLVVAIALLLH